MSKIICKDVIDLTDDLPNGATTAEPDIEFIGETRRTSQRASSSRRRKSNDSDIIIIEDEVPEVIDVPSIPPVACHFFYPSEEDGSTGVGGGNDPLAPTPEWVDCSTLHSEQVSVDDDFPALESSHEKNATSFAYIDPLSIGCPVKSEPGIDVKPSLEQLSEMVNPIGSSRLNNVACVGNSSIKKEILDVELDLNSVSYKRKNSEDVDSSNTIPAKKINIKRKAGPKCAKFRRKENKNNSLVNGLKKALDIALNATVPSVKIDTRRRVGPKCAKFRVKEREATINTNKQNTTVKCDSKDSVSSKENHVQIVETEENIAIKPAVVSIGPKLPLPKCFQQKQSLSEEALHCTKYDFIHKNGTEEHTNLDNDHIVLKIYTCIRCNHKCTDPLFHEAHVALCNSKRHSRSLNFNLQNCIESNGFYRCEICIFKFRNKENLNTHLNQHGGNGFTCHICQLTFLTLCQLKQHTVDNHKNLEKIFSCNICQYSSQNVHHVREHMIRHNKDKHLFCYSCKHNCEDSDGIEKHRKECHKRTEMKERKSNRIKQNKKEGSIVMNSLADKKNTMLTGSNEQSEAVDSNINLKVIAENSLPADTALFNDTKSSLKAFEEQIIKRDGIYHCNGCVYKFTHLKNLIEHKKHHLRNEPFSCCDGSFVSFSYIDYSKHIEKNHENHGLNKYYCNVCPLTYTTAHSLGRHLMRHVNDGLYCYHCKKNLENANVWKIHMTSKHVGAQVAKYACSECSFKTAFENKLKRHTLLIHRKDKIQSEMLSHLKVSEPEVNETRNLSTRKKIENKLIYFDPSPKPNLCVSAFKCEECRLKFRSAVALQEHNKAKHEQGQSLVKEECSKSFKNEEFKCNKCSFKCSQPGMFIEHMKIGHTKSKFVCNVCRADFAFLKLYMDHMKNHAACAVVYSCNECRFTSRKGQIFGKHMRTHALKCCPLCDYKTLRSDSFKTHLQTIHTIENEHPSSSNLNDVSCANSRVVQTKANELETLDSASTNVIKKPHDCCFCTFKTNNVYSLRRHIAIHFTSSSKKNQVSKPSLTVKRWRNKTIPSKKSRGEVSKVSKPRDKERNNVALLYCCSKCDYKKKSRRSVADHIFKYHHIRGSVRNHTIKKVFVKVAQTDKIRIKTDRKMGSVKKQKRGLELDQNLSHAADLYNMGVNDELKSVNVLQTHEKNVEGKTNKNKPSEPSKIRMWQCSSCDLQKLSLLAQLQHKKYGHMEFWRRSFSCKICGFRCADKGSLSKHVKWKHAGFKKEHQHTSKVEMHLRDTEKHKKTDQSSCNVDDINKQNLTVKNNKERTVSGIVKCQGCDIESLSPFAQQHHNKVGHDKFWDKPFSCEICGVRCMNKGALASHRLRHKSSLNCSTCNSYVTTKPDCLEEHKKMCGTFREVKIDKSDTLASTNHSSIKGRENGGRGLDLDYENYICGECDFTTTDVIKFSTHMFIHSGIPDD